MPSSRSVKYTNAEQRMLALLPGNGERITSDKIIKLYYRGVSRPYYARQIVIAILRGLHKKTRHNRDTFMLQKSKRQGPRPMEFWIEKKGPSQ